MVLPCLMSAFNSIGGSCFGCIKTEAAHLFAYGDNIENLRTQVQNLSDAIESVNVRIEEAESRGATRVDPVVVRLLERMASLKEEASKLTRDEEREADSRCLMGLRPNLWACYLASKSAKKAIDEAVELLEEKNKFDGPVANVDRSKCLGVTPNSDFEKFDSRVAVSNQIVEALNDPSVNMVGVYGMGGTGKTTLAEKMGAELQLNGTFNYVVLATVSEKQSLLQNNYQSNLTSIQKQIAGGLKIQLQGETLNDRATQLRDLLQKKDKVLIILDDIWSKFELKDVGIPVGSSVHTKFKILMTSRDKIVLENQMDSRKTFGLDCLPFDDARNLFDKMVGGASEYSNWRPTAEQVVKECGGIPILLATTARALRNVNRSIWEDALTQLKQFHGVDYGEEAYKRIEVSYKFLKSEEIRKLLLLCAQLDHRYIPMEDLLKYAMGLDLFKGCKKVKEVSGRLHKYLRDLKGCCLLQDGNEEGIIKMHDVVHKFATCVAFRDHHVYSVANDGELEEWPSKDQFEKFTAISFFYCRLPSDHELPVAFDNPKLESFLMLRRKIDASFKIPDNFFSGMKGLKLMNLTKMFISPALVSSLSALVEIRTLCLDGCELGDIAVIGELPMLQALSVAGSSIVCVPKEIGKLGSTLKLLDLSGCSKLKTIASGVISRLTLLEDLRIGDSFTRWEQLQRSSSNNISADETYEAEMASLEELKNLRNLINLEIHIREHAKMFPKDLVFTKLETFKIFIGGDHLAIGRYMLPRTLELVEFSTLIEFASEGTKALMTRAESLVLSGVESSVSVSEIDPKGFPELKHLEVNYGDGIQYIVKKNYNNCIFPKLETLRLWRLDKLERICDDHDHLLPVGSFQNLRVINVARCNLLNDLLSSNLARGLLRLKEIRVWDCESMESIIVSKESENEEEIKIGFTDELRVLQLHDLPCLLSFYRLKQLEGVPVPSPTLFNKKIVFSKLEELSLGEIKVEKIWDDESAISVGRSCWLQNLTSLKVDKCGNLSYLFTSSMVESLAKLKKLQVVGCKSIEEIVASTEKETAGEIHLSFPKLDYLELKDLPKLKRFCHAKLLECQLLRVDMCGNLSYLFTSSMVESLAKLKQLQVVGCGSIEEIVASTEKETAGEIHLSFPKLDNLELKDLPKLKRFCHAKLLECQLLRELLIQNCVELRTLISTNDSSPDNSGKVAFPNMERLEIVRCRPVENVFDVQILAMNERETCRILPFQKLERICDDHDHPLSVGSFENLRVIIVSECGLLKDLLSSNLARGLLHLKEIRVMSCWNMESLIVSRESENEEEIKIGFTDQLLVLELHDLPCLLSFYRFKQLEGVPVPSGTTLFNKKIVFPKLKKLRLLRLSWYGMVKIWDDESRWLKNLTSLVVVECRIKLVASSSTTKSLVNLKEMSLRQCHFLEEIIVINDQCDELANNDEYIVFEKLEVLNLHNLQSLTSFCSASNCNFQFPLLNKVIVKKCPKMIFFSKGALSTPKVIWVFLEDLDTLSLSFHNMMGGRSERERKIKNVARWEGDLNSTIRQLSEETVKEEIEERKRKWTRIRVRKELEERMRKWTSMRIEDDGDEHEDEEV